MPSYLCNWSCSYCYLGNLRTNPDKLQLNKLKERLDEIKSTYHIDAINIYGGEVTLLNKPYFQSLIDIAFAYASHISCSTNNPVHPYVQEFKEIRWATSINEERTYNQQTVQALLLNESEHKPTVMQVVTPSLLKTNPKNILNLLNNISSAVTFLRYFPSKNNPTWKISNTEYSNFLKNIITEYIKNEYSFVLHNILELNYCMSDDYDPTMQSNLFINPDGKLCIVAYDKNNLEYFKNLDSVSSFQDEANKELDWYKQTCSHCKYYGSCYAEHIMSWEKGDICCGLKPLLDWYGENIYQNYRSL